MDEPFVIPVTYKTKVYYFDAQLFTSAYNYRIEIVIDSVLFFFERDDEGRFRAVAAMPDHKNMEKIDMGLLEATTDAIEKILA